MVRPSNAPKHAQSGENAKKHDRKKRRFRPGTKALMDIRKQQGKASTKGALRKDPFSRLVREIACGLDSGDKRWSVTAITMLQAATEEHIIDTMKAANEIAISSGKETIGPKHMQVARRVDRLLNSGKQ